MAPKYPYFNLTFPAQHVAHVEIERPNKLNAFCTPMWHGMRDIFEKVSIDPEVRCVVLSGAGERAFTAGMYHKAGHSLGRRRSRGGFKG